MNDTKKEMMSMKEASEHTGFAKSSIHRWVMDEKLTNHQTDDAPNAEILISLSELQQYIEDNQLKPRSKSSIKSSSRQTVKPSNYGPKPSLERAQEVYLNRLLKAADKLEQEIADIERKKQELATVKAEIDRIKNMTKLDI